MDSCGRRSGWEPSLRFHRSTRVRPHATIIRLQCAGDGGCHCCVYSSSRSRTHISSSVIRWAGSWRWHVLLKSRLVLAGLILVAPSPPSPEPMEEDERNRLLTVTWRPCCCRADPADPLCGFLLSSGDKAICIDDNLRTSASGWDWWLASGSRENIVSRGRRNCVPGSRPWGNLDPVIPPRGDYHAGHVKT